MSAPRLLTMRQTAALLGMEYDSFRRQRDDLVKDHKMPRPVPFHPQPHWDAAAIARWLDLYDPHLEEWSRRTGRPEGSAASLEAELRERAQKLAAE